jgi:hypothetical protein
MAVMSFTSNGTFQAYYLLTSFTVKFQFFVFMQGTCSHCFFDETVGRNVQEVIYIKRWLQLSNSSFCDLMTGWTGYTKLSLLVSDCQWHQALLAVDMTALEYFRRGVSFAAN